MKKKIVFYLLLAVVFMQCTQNEYDKRVKLEMRGYNNYILWQEVWTPNTENIYLNIEFVETDNIDSVYKNRVELLKEIEVHHKRVMDNNR